MGFVYKPGGGGGGDDLMSRTWGNETWLHRYATDPGMTWGAQLNATADFGDGGLVFTGDPASALLAAVFHGDTIPASGDWAYVSEISVIGINHDDAMIGQLALTGNTVASPTQILSNSYYYDSIVGPGNKTNTWTSYTAGFSLLGEPYCADNTQGVFRKIYLVMGWDDGAGKIHTGMFGGYTQSKGGSMDGLDDLGVQTKPIDLGFVAGSNAGGQCAILVHMSKLVPVADASVWPYPELIGR